MAAAKGTSDDRGNPPMVNTRPPKSSPSCKRCAVLVQPTDGDNADILRARGGVPHYTGSQDGSLCLQATLRRHSRYALLFLVFSFFFSPSRVGDRPRAAQSGYLLQNHSLATSSDTRASNYYRHDIPTATIVPPPSSAADQEGHQQQQQPNRWRFWNRQKTVVA